MLHSTRVSHVSSNTPYDWFESIGMQEDQRDQRLYKLNRLCLIEKDVSSEKEQKLKEHYEDFRDKLGAFDHIQDKLHQTIAKRDQRFEEFKFHMRFSEDQLCVAKLDRDEHKKLFKESAFKISCLEQKIQALERDLECAERDQEELRTFVFLTGKLQQTLASSIERTGITLHSGESSTAKLFPAMAGEGRFFICGDHRIPASIDFAKDTALCTTLCKQGVRVRMVEHLLSALEGLGVDNCRIEIVGADEVPLLDGSAREWVEEIEKVGVCVAKDCDGNSMDKLAPYLHEPVHVWKNDSFVAAFPSPKVHITYGINFPQCLHNFRGWTYFFRAKRDLLRRQSMFLSYVPQIGFYSKLGYEPVLRTNALAHNDRIHKYVILLTPYPLSNFEDICHNDAISCRYVDEDGTKFFGDDEDEFGMYLPSSLCLSDSNNDDGISGDHFTFAQPKFHPEANTQLWKLSSNINAMNTAIIFENSVAFQEAFYNLGKHLEEPHEAHGQTCYAFKTTIVSMEKVPAIDCQWFSTAPMDNFSYVEGIASSRTFCIYEEFEGEVAMNMKSASYLTTLDVAR
ncbi:hypothetical protein GIB67_020879 [Kingdonia uniflora]|uniref:UDP-3-O-acyl-N-acetylglucosamine deacetylase n=1 Tax=Kingdonia uniflora TaxID=39325 RepID=A0A7J7M7F2_9MAGN|nr:hypothetical protein GIB67_020879 [Kingdonia uniflora]